MRKPLERLLHLVIARDGFRQLPQQGHNIGLERLQLIAQGGVHNPMGLGTMGLDVNFLAGEHIVPQLETVFRRYLLPVLRRKIKNTPEFPPA